MTVQENLRLGAYTRGMTRDGLDSVYALFPELAERRDAPAVMLSGGQQQRIVIARAMLREPKLIVADEPVSMLDASVRVEILKLMSALQESHGLSVIYITHDLSTVKYFSRRIFVMYAAT